MPVFTTINLYIAEILLLAVGKQRDVGVKVAIPLLTDKGIDIGVGSTNGHWSQEERTRKSAGAHRASLVFWQHHSCKVEK